MVAAFSKLHDCVGQRNLRKGVVFSKKPPRMRKNEEGRKEKKI